MSQLARAEKDEVPLAALPYSRQLIDDEDVAAVVDALRSDYVAQGPRVEAFEAAFGQAVGAPEAVACSSGTAALHLALAGLGIGEGDVCIVPAITFLSTATAALYCGAEVVFADVDPDTGLMTAATLREALGRAGPAARAVLPVHLGGRACEIERIAEVAREARLRVVEDGCHAVGTRMGEQAVGDCAWSDATCFSFHPVKTLACGEGGMVTTRDATLAARLRRLRNHGVTRDPELMTETALSFSEPGRPNPWSYEQLELGFNYRMTDVEAALGRSQLRKLPRFVERRAELAARYDELLRPLEPLVVPVKTPEGQAPSLHLYVVRLQLEALGQTRAELMRALAERGVGTQVHYIPMYRQPFFAGRYGPMRLPGAEAYYADVLALPLFPAMSEADVDRVVLELARALGR